MEWLMFTTTKELYLNPIPLRLFEEDQAYAILNEDQTITYIFRKEMIDYLFPSSQIADEFLSSIDQLPDLTSGNVVDLFEISLIEAIKKQQPLL
ncbi:hypothetical protein [Photobacterium damselae]|uniref:hypothetical protein n=1 Tax=Photobacterium damselae TaxID=38293 RepID=UPI000DF9481F|nr:hypothetical protein [Photobacterium damselae]SUB90647.1 Uncharacterised protein [Photobacterium damselae]